MPYFNPFDELSDKISDNLAECDEVYETFASNSHILSCCEYYDIPKLVQKCESLSKTSNFILVGLNIDGFKSNFDNFKIFNNELLESGVDVTCYSFSETNVLETESAIFYLDGFNKFILDKFKINDGLYKKKGSGLAVYLTKKITNAKKEVEHCLSTPDIEILTISFSANDTFIHYIISVYRSPNGNFDNFISNLDVTLTKINRHNSKLHIIGDFNTDLYHPERKNCKNYLDCIFSNSVYPLISRATHFQYLNPTCIDNILTNDISNILASGVILFNVTHHMPIFSISEFDLIPNSNLPTKRQFLCINDKTINGFITDFNCKYHEYEDLEIHSAKDSFHQFTVIFKELYDKWFLHEKKDSCKNVHTKSEWITPALAKSSETKNIFYQKWRKHRTSQNWNNYISYKRKLDSLKNKVKYEYYNNKFLNCKNNTKKVWQEINNVLGRKKRNSTLSFESEEASHNFNKYFTSIAGNLVSTNYSQSAHSNEAFRNYLTPGIWSYNHTQFDVSNLKNIISGLNNSKYTDYSPRVLKSLSNFISPTLTKLFNKCYCDGYFPDDLKTAKVLPLFKNKGCLTDISNYRPISMLPIFSKLFEKMIHQKLWTFLDENNIINENQFGFRASHSTAHALISATENLYKSLDNDLHTLGIFIDFSKAFDTVNHSILCSKLEHYGIQDNMLKLIESYLSNRDQYVLYGNKASSKLPITLGVPQGSVLGPLLFILYINDIVNATSIAKFVLFADDSNLFISHIDRFKLYELGNQLLRDIFLYCAANYLVINYDKCCFIEFKRPNNVPKINLSFPFNSIESEEKCKFLGVYINSNLDWNDQIAHARKLVSQAIGALYSIRHNVPLKILRTVYFSLVQPYFIYAMPIWATNHNSIEFQMLFKLQKKAIRIISKKLQKLTEFFNIPSQFSKV